jgi:predicted adenine nucleotide alpha hydrolase (AANH) superfamily ATPase
MNINYSKELDNKIEQIVSKEQVPSLLLHSCCAPCSSYVLEYLANYFKITVFYYNPNIYPEKEYRRRVQEQINFIQEFKTKNKVEFIEGKYDSESFYRSAKGMEDEKEGGSRCTVCFELRLREVAIMAKSGNYDYFTTTLSISPHKDVKRLNNIGGELSKEYGVNYLFSDFKKKEGYKRSIELSKEYNLYRQDYCGCIFSKRERSNS